MEGNKITHITEKPSSPDSDYAVTGFYLYDSKVFDFIKMCKPSERGEMEISDVNNIYVDKGLCSYHILDGWWSDAGTFSSLQRVNQLLVT